MKNSGIVRGRPSYKNKSLSDITKSPNQKSPNVNRLNRTAQEDFNGSDTFENSWTRSKSNYLELRNYKRSKENLLNISDLNRLQRDESLENETDESKSEEEEEEEMEVERFPIVHETVKASIKAEEMKKINWTNSTAFLFLIIACLSIYFYLKPAEITTMNLTTLRNNFPNLNNEMWLALETGIEEVNSFNKPTVLFYIYKPQSETLTNNYITKISSFASAQLTQTPHASPILLTPSDLNIPSAKRDYGFVIKHYHQLLKSKRVMVVRNVDEIDGFVAQVFHTLCDEVSPLVPKSLFIFTMRVKDFVGGSDFKLVERVLREKWGLDDEIFEPLLTRITSIILRID